MPIASFCENSGSDVPPVKDNAVPEGGFQPARRLLVTMRLSRLRPPYWPPEARAASSPSRSVVFQLRTVLVVASLESK